MFTILPMFFQILIAHAIYKIPLKVANCGLGSNAKLYHLKYFLRIIAILAPLLLKGDIINDAT